MPELPEVETMRRALAQLAGKCIERVRTPRARRSPLAVTPSWRSLARRLAGRRLSHALRWGKRVGCQLDDHSHLVFQPRMTGLLILGPPPTPEHVHLTLYLSGGTVLHYWDQRALGSISWLPSGQLMEELRRWELGPDALEVSCQELRERLASRRQPVKVALMDQRVLAGIGNLYASEILHRAGIHPATPCCLLPAAQWRRIHRSIRQVLEEAIAAGGSTLGDATYQTPSAGPGGYQHQHRVYGREGEACGTCGRGRIRRIIQAQRSTFFCPRCQPGRRLLANGPATGLND